MELPPLAHLEVSLSFSQELLPFLQSLVSLKLAIYKEEVLLEGLPLLRSLHIT